jgi:DNA modification methylase
MQGHPAMYPDELAYRLIKMFSYEGDTVLDPFLGSGTTIKVARQLGREAIGYEREDQYKQVIMEKLGVGEDGVITQSMVGFAKEMTISQDVEEIVKKAEAEAADNLPESKTEVPETETV